jgi:predicted glycogen debranching enzyme
MLPNRFPDEGQAPEYNTVDATLWYFEAIRAYCAATGDTALLRDLFPVLADIVDWHVRGTRYQIHVDPADGLLYAGEPGVQLTWMDAKVEDWVVTPRTGRPVEVNALWYNALCIMAEIARLLEKDGRRSPDNDGRRS